MAPTARSARSAIVPMKIMTSGWGTLPIKKRRTAITHTRAPRIAITRPCNCTVQRCRVMVPEVAHRAKPALIECCTKESASAAIAVDAAGTAVMLSMKPITPVMSEIKANATRSFSIMTDTAFGWVQFQHGKDWPLHKASRNEHGRARGGPRVKRLMGKPDIRELEALIDRDLDRARGDDREKIVGGFLELTGIARVIGERRTGH